MVDSDVEYYARWLSTKQGIDPDKIGHTITKKTIERLGEGEYPLWQYQVPLAEAIMTELLGL